MNEFKQFQIVFKEYQRMFGLMGYKVYFKYEPINAFASITTNTNEMVATVFLNKQKAQPFKNIGRSAKHEALHLLLDRLEDLAMSRYTNEVEIGKACEELVFKLETLIPDIKDTK